MTTKKALSQELVKSIETGNLSLLSQLIQQGKEINASSSNGWTPLMLALLHDRLEAAELLLSNGADPNLATDSEENPCRYPLAVAVSNGRLEAVKLLLTHQADKEQTDSNGMTTLDLARERALRPFKQEAMLRIVSLLSEAVPQHLQNDALITSAT